MISVDNHASVSICLGYAVGTGHRVLSYGLSHRRLPELEPLFPLVVSFSQILDFFLLSHFGCPDETPKSLFSLLGIFCCSFSDFLRVPYSPIRLGRKLIRVLGWKLWEGGGYILFGHFVITPTDVMAQEWQR